MSDTITTLAGFLTLCAIGAACVLAAAVIGHVFGGEQ